MLDDILSPAEAAALAEVHEDTIKRWARTGRIPAIRTPGGWWRFRREDVLAINEPVIHGVEDSEPGDTAA